MYRVSKCCYLTIGVFMIIEGNGKSANLLKPGSKRRRTKDEIALARMDQQNRDAQASARIREIEELRARVNQVEEEKKNNDAAAGILRGFIDAGHAEMIEGGGVRLKSGIDSHQVAEQQRRRSEPPRIPNLLNRRVTMNQDPRDAQALEEQQREQQQLQERLDAEEELAD